VAVADDVMAVMGYSKETGFRAYRITPTAAEKMWQVDATDRGSSPVLANGCVYGFATGRVLCVNLADGRVRWEQNLGGGDIAPLVLVGDRLLVSAGSERLASLDAAPGGTGAVLAKAKMKLPRAVSPSVAGGRWRAWRGTGRHRRNR
jgi:outer membrane protein assembly factor BamB